MSFQIPDKAKACKLSPIRAVIARGEEIPDFISLALGNPAVEAIPADIICREAKKLMEDHATELLPYGPALGDAGLKEWIKKRLTTQKGMSGDQQEVVITNGASQALGLVARAFTNPGDEVYVEAFSYPSALNAIRCADAKVVGINVDEKGMLPEELEKAAAGGKGRYLYLNPTFQNPTGATMPLERRKEIYEICKKYDLLILEDDPYGEIRFKGEEVPTFKSIDTEGIVLYVGSFSKILSAGLRVGYMYGDVRYTSLLAAVKNNMDGESPLYNQKIVLHTLQAMDFEEHLKRIQKIYADKCKAMQEVLKEQCSSKVRLSSPEGGMFLWVTLPEDTDMDKFQESLFAHAVGAVKSEAFASNPEYPGNAFRLNYTSLTEDKLKEGAARFAAVTREFFGD